MDFINGFRKRKRHVAMCVAVPHNIEQFRKHYQRHTDFLTQVLQSERNGSFESLWAAYTTTASRIENCIRELKQLNVTVYDQCTASDIRKAQAHDVVIVMAHKHSVSNQVELCEELLSPIELCNLFDKNFSGAIDLACCNSIDILNLLVTHCPNHRPIVAPSGLISIDIHAVLLPFIVNTYLHARRKEYVEAFHDVYLEAAMLRKSQETSLPLTMLGKKNNYSSVYAPQSAYRGTNFTVQVYLHGDADRNEIDIRAKAKDSRTELKDTISLKLKLEDGDNIKVRLQIANNLNKDFRIIENDTIDTYWDGGVESHAFMVHVEELCHEETCNCILQLFVNNKKVGTIFFNVDIVNKQQEVDPQPAVFEKIETNADSSREALLALRQIIMKHLQNNPENEDSKAILNRCLSLLEDIEKMHDKGVFVSSTSELSEARQAVARGINSVYQIPVMYEHWPALAMRPVDACSKEVMASECFVLLLGSHYGYIEDSIGISMTQIEYLVAQYCDKPILVFAEKGLVEHKSGINEDQQKFINQVMKDYIVKEYSTMQELSNGVQLALMQLSKRT